MTTRIDATAGIYDGQYYAFDYDKMMGLDGEDDHEPEAVQPPRRSSSRRPTCSGSGDGVSRIGGAGGNGKRRIARGQP